MRKLLILILMLQIPHMADAAAQEEATAPPRFGRVTAYNNEAAVTSLSWSPTECQRRHIAVGSYSSNPNTYTVNIWDIGSGNCSHTLEGIEGNVIVKHSPDGNYIAASGSSEVRTFDTSTMQEQSKIDVAQWIDTIKESVSTIDWSDNIAVGTASISIPKILIIDSRSNQLAHQLQGHRDRINSLCCSPNQHHLASASYDKTVKLWDLRKTNQCTHTFDNHNNWVTSVGYSPDGTQLVSGSIRNMLMGPNPTLCTRNAQTGEVLTEFDHGKSVAAVCYILGTQCIVSVSNKLKSPHTNTVKVWNLESRECQILDEHNNRIWSVCPSPKENQFAVGDQDGKVIIYGDGAENKKDK